MSSENANCQTWVKAKVGKLDKWELKRSVLADGITLYGKYKSQISGECYSLISFSPIKNINKRNKIVRILFGREEKGFKTGGVIIRMGGRKLSPTVFLVPLQFSSEIISALRKEKVDFQIREVWGLQKL